MAFNDVPFPARANPDEIATISAAGHRFDDWESVFVQHRWADAFAWFRFTSAERESDPPSFDWQTLRLKSPDPVAIYLGGQLAINGLITSRQVAYESANLSFPKIPSAWIRAMRQNQRIILSDAWVP